MVRERHPRRDAFEQRAGLDVEAAQLRVAFLDRRRGRAAIRRMDWARSR
ncbi:hypothetical protein OED52_04155 [Rhodococcus sp. Z13]|uniref:Uncharacterized protein n=1 Tax=Rhodococcus sacchari TaxID=2962047 RepID=A0ACD4DIF9_9NOCA|nr:hypothetical protein [Rhodococcus sp. Z13]UYP19758.1 hypothetical protein OED52_04155 [Rhodococcus sp. Z13]